MNTEKFLTLCIAIVLLTALARLSDISENIISQTCKTQQKQPPKIQTKNTQALGVQNSPLVDTLQSG